MARYLKTGIAEEQSRAADEKVRETVERILRDTEARGDVAIRECSERFDRWSPKSFRLSREEIADLVAQIAPGTRHDIEFAQDQIRRFAVAQRGGRS